MSVSLSCFRNRLTLLFDNCLFWVTILVVIFFFIYHIFTLCLFLIYMYSVILVYGHVSCQNGSVWQKRFKFEIGPGNICPCSGSFSRHFVLVRANIRECGGKSESLQTPGKKEKIVKRNNEVDELIIKSCKTNLSQFLHGCLCD